VSAMEDAGTVDLRGQEDLPYLLQVMGPTAPGAADPRAQEMHDRLATWLTNQTHRRDLDHNGEYDDPQSPAIIDAWWPRLSHAMFDANSANAIDALGLTLDDPDRRLHIGSSFDDAFYSHVNKDLRQVLGLPVADSWSRTYCGGGVLADCKTALWNAMSQAAADLEAEFGSPNVADWKRAIADEDVRQTAVGVTSVPAIHWINRPTFQQVVQISRGACGNTPASGCKQPTAGGASLLDVRNGTPDSKDRLLWKWSKGATTSLADLGNPLATTNYEFCLYDGDANLVSHASAPAGGSCNAASPRPCWKQTSTGFKYVDKDLTPNGVQKLLLKAGTAGKPSILLKGRGDLLDTPALPISSLPVRAQLMNGDGVCWEGQYATTLRDQGDRFKAKSN